MNEFNVNTDAASSGEIPNGTVLFHGVSTVKGLSENEMHRLKGNLERSESYKCRFNAIMPRVRETNPQLATKIEALPYELTGYNLAPLFEEAKEWHGGGWSESDGWSALEYREKMWVPSLENLGESYNGPMGAHGEPYHRHVEMWHLAKRFVEARELAVFACQMEGDIELVTRCLGRQPLAVVVQRLLSLAFGVEGKPEPDCFTDSDIEDMPANLAALRLIRVALDELDKMCANNIVDRRQWVREELARVEAISSEMGFGPVLEVETPEAK